MQVVGCGGGLGAFAPTVSEAREILRRFCASHFGRHDQEHARASIPADPRRDDDIRMAAFIDRVERLEAVLANAKTLLCEKYEFEAAAEIAELLKTSSPNMPSEPRGT